MKIKIENSKKQNTLEEIQKNYIADELIRVQTETERILERQKGYITDTELNLYKRGKKIRASVLLLFAKACGGGEVSEKIIQAAAATEILHTATLIHDDIIDGAKTRRNLPTVNSERGINHAILIGDMQFLEAIRGFAGTIDAQSDISLVNFVLETAFEVCKGELDELNTAISEDISDYSGLAERYIETARRKTGVVFGLACESAVRLSTPSLSDARRAGFFGRNFGISFQIMDDISDFDKTSDKTNGIDIVNKTLSLPIIYALEETGKDSLTAKAFFFSGSESAAEKETAAEKAREEIIKSRALPRAYSTARHFSQEAVETLSFFDNADQEYIGLLKELALSIV
jgi:heptaprenyl diphosphate synthase